MSFLFRYNRIQARSEFRSNSSCVYTSLQRLICNGSENDILDCQDSIWDLYDSCQYVYAGVNCRMLIYLLTYILSVPVLDGEL
jgi:hypothetical protein